jgi:hypothetical protein
MLGGKVASAYRRQAVTGRVQISPWPLGMMAKRRKTARSLCEGSDMPKAERTRAEATRLRRPGGQRVPAELLEHPTRKQQAEAIEALAARLRRPGRLAGDRRPPLGARALLDERQEGRPRWACTCGSRGRVPADGGGPPASASYLPPLAAGAASHWVLPPSRAACYLAARLFSGAPR